MYKKLQTIMTTVVGLTNRSHGLSGFFPTKIILSQLDFSFKKIKQ